MGKLLAIVLIAGLSGCASADYAKYADSQAAMQLARSNSESERYKAMASISAGGDTTTRVAAMMALMGQGQQQSPAASFAPPKSGSEVTREWLALILPTAVQAWGIGANQKVAIAQSDNARMVALSTNSAFVGMAGEIQAPPANVITTNTGSYNSTPTSTTNTGSNNITPTTNTSTSTDSHNSDDHSSIDDHTVTGSNNTTIASPVSVP